MRHETNRKEVRISDIRHLLIYFVRKAYARLAKLSLREVQNRNHLKNRGWLEFNRQNSNNVRQQCSSNRMLRACIT